MPTFGSLKKQIIRKNQKRVKPHVNDIIETHVNHSLLRFPESGQILAETEYPIFSMECPMKSQ